MHNSKPKKPFASLFIFLYYIVRGYISFPKGEIGKDFVWNGKTYRIFRHMVFSRSVISRGGPGSIFKVTGQFKSGNNSTNKRKSAVAIPFIAVQPGFRSKKWGISTDGYVLGFYEWDSLEDVKNYKKSFPMKMMRSRVVAVTYKSEAEEV